MEKRLGPQPDGGPHSADAVDQMVRTIERARDQAAAQQNHKGMYIGAPACFALELAIRPVCEAYHAYAGSGGCYVVGSVLERPDWRDVDIRLMLSDAVFALEFPDAGEHWEHDAKWLLLTLAISRHLSDATGLPIDFQFQPQTKANEHHGKKRRSPIGLRLTTAG